MFRRREFNKKKVLGLLSALELCSPNDSEFILSTARELLKSLKNNREKLSPKEKVRMIRTMSRTKVWIKNNHPGNSHDNYRALEEITNNLVKML